MVLSKKTLHNENWDGQSFQTKMESPFSTMEMEDVLDVYVKAKSDQLLNKRSRLSLDTLKHLSSN